MPRRARKDRSPRKQQFKEYSRALCHLRGGGDFKRRLYVNPKNLMVLSARGLSAEAAGRKFKPDPNLSFAR